MMGTALALLPVVASSSQLGAKIWYIGSSGADFTDIQPAIDASTDGDVILCNPAATRTSRSARA